MAFLTREQFTTIAVTKAVRKSLNQSLLEARTKSRAFTISSIFLSHCHTDVDIVKEAISFFNGLNASVYVDWMDATMPQQPNGTTAAKIKTKIRQNDKFILLATNNAIQSKWCNWELGIGDTHKLNSEKLAIMPLADSRGAWAGNEYLQIYPRIEPSWDGDTGEYFKVIYPDGIEVWFDRWILL